MKDIHNNISAVQAIVPAVKTAAGEGATIDTRGFNGLEFVVNTGAIVSDGDFGIAIQDSATGSGDWEATTKVLGSFPATLEANSTYRVGYVGSKRYVRINVTKEGGTSIALGAVAILGHPAVAPVA